MDSIYRDLAPDEVVKAKGLEKTRTQCEMVVYRLLPKSMKEKVDTMVAQTPELHKMNIHIGSLSKKDM